MISDLESRVTMLEAVITRMQITMIIHSFITLALGVVLVLVAFLG